MCMWGSIPRNNNTIISRSVKQSWSQAPVNSIGRKIQFLRYSDFEWVVHSPDTFIDALYPRVDHSLGRRSGNYLLFTTQTPRKLWDRAVVVSDHYHIDNNRSFCLKLYYYGNTLQSIGNSGFEIYQVENNGINKKIAKVILTQNTTSWTQLIVRAKAMSGYSKNMWFSLV